MRPTLPCLVAALTAALLCACGSNDRFEVTATIESLGVETLTLDYTDGTTAMHINAHAPKADKPVELEGSSADYTLALLRRSDGSISAFFPVRNGQEIKVTVDSAGTRLSGSEACDSLAALLAALRPLSPTLRSDSVARYIERNPGSVVSGVALVMLFDAAAMPGRADSLFTLLQPQARPVGVTAGWREQLAMATLPELGRRINPITLYGKGDSTLTYSASAHSHTVLAFVSDTRPDSVSRLLGKLRRAHSTRRLGIMEISVATDSLSWNLDSARDTARWQRAWVPGGTSSPVLRRLSVPRTPFFIVADSAGRQHYRGSSTSAVNAEISRLTNP